MNNFILLSCVFVIISCSGNNINSDETSKNTSIKEVAELTDSSGTSLLSAIQENDADKVLEMINNGADVNEKESWDSKTPLILASELGHLNIVKILIDNGADISLGSGEFEIYNCPVGAAIRANNLEVIKYYVNEGVDINQYHPIWYVNIHHESMFNYLIEQGMDINDLNSMDAEWEVSRLCFALCNDQMETVEFLLDKGARLDLSTAMNIKKEEQFEPLINAGLNFSTLTNQIEENVGDIGVYSILSGKNKDVVRGFLRNGLAPTPNTIATIFPCCEGSDQLENQNEIFEIVLEHVTTNDPILDLNKTHTFHQWVIYPGITEATQDNKTTLLGLAALAENASAIALLIKYGANPEVKDNKGNLPVDYAHKAEVKALLE